MRDLRGQGTYGTYGTCQNKQGNRMGGGGCDIGSNEGLTGSHGVSWGLTGSHGVSWGLTGSHGVSWVFQHVDDLTLTS